MEITASRVVVVTNIPTPYRNPIYALLPPSFTIVFSARSEPNRSWHFPKLLFSHLYLRERFRAKPDGISFIHYNPDIWRVLSTLKPDVVVTTGFSPTQVLAFIWANLRRVAHVSMTDGTLLSEARLHWYHKLARRIVYSRSRAFIGASQGSRQLFESYGVNRNAIFQSPLCANNSIFYSQGSRENRPYDVMFAGRFHELKRPELFVGVCKLLRSQRGSCRALLVGDGPLRESVIADLAAASVDYNFVGFRQEAELPQFYSQARILLFTTCLDAWGVVANEALASGTPVITSPEAGVANELVIDGVTGAVRPLDVTLWCEAARRLLEDPAHWRACSIAGRKLVQAYNYQAAAAGIEAACAYALSVGSPGTELEFAL